MLDHLRYFQAVARCGSLSAAARVLQISQPSLTALIKQLEEELRDAVAGPPAHRRVADQHRRGASPIRERVAHPARGDGAADRGPRVRRDRQLRHRLSRVARRRFPAAVDDAVHGEQPAHPAHALQCAFEHRAQRHGGAQRALRAGGQSQPHPDLVQIKLFRDAVDLFVLADSAPPASDLDAAKERLRRGPLVFAGRICNRSRSSRSSPR